MTKTFLTLSILLISINLHSQTPVYYDDNWEETTEENAAYYRIVTAQNKRLQH